MLTIEMSITVGINGSDNSGIHRWEAMTLRLHFSRDLSWIILPGSYRL